MKTKYQDKDIRWKWLAEKGYNVQKDENQLEYMKSLWADIKEVQSVFVNASAGTGKTSLAVAAGVYEVEKGTYDKIIYIRNTVAVRNQGYLPGDIDAKENVFYAPLIDALYSLHHDGYQNWYETDSEHQKIVMTSTSYLRGVNFKNAFIIIDEAQSLDLLEMQTVLTRIHDSCKIVVIGSTLQNDNDKMKYYSGLTPFELYMEHFKDELSKTHYLFRNYRGRFSSHADNIGYTIKTLQEIK